MALVNYIDLIGCNVNPTLHVPTYLYHPPCLLPYVHIDSSNEVLYIHVVSYVATCLSMYLCIYVSILYSLFFILYSLFSIIYLIGKNTVMVTFYFDYF